MKLSTYAKKLSAQRPLTRNDIVSLAKAAGKDGKINKAERSELTLIRDSMADRMDRSAKSALTGLINNIPEDISRRGRAVDPARVDELIQGDPRLAWRAESGRGGGESAYGRGWSSTGGGE